MGYLIPVRDTPLGLARLGELLGNCRRRRRRRWRHLVPIVALEIKVDILAKVL